MILRVDADPINESASWFSETNDITNKRENTGFWGEFLLAYEVYLKFDPVYHVSMCYSHFKSCPKLVKLFFFHRGKNFMRLKHILC